MAVAAMVLCVFDAAPGVSFAAAWDGGRLCDVYLLDSGMWGPCVERWDMWNQRADGPGVPCTPDGLRELVEFRLEDRAATAQLVAAAREFDRAHIEPGTPRGRAPEFSAN